MGIQTSQSPPKAAPNLLESRAASVLADLRAALAAVLGATGVPISRPLHLKEALNLHQTLAWKVHRFAHSSELLKDAQFIPGAAGFSTFLRAAATHGVPESTIAAAKSAYDHYRALVSSHAADRASFELLLTGLAEADSQSPADGRSIRRGGFRCASATWGVQMRQKMVCHMIGPSEKPDHVDFIILRGSFGLRRLRPGVPLSIFPATLSGADGEIVPTRAGQPLEPHNVTRGLALLPQFCSQPTPQICIGKNPAGIPEYQLGGGVIGDKEGLSIVTGERYFAAGTKYADAVNSYGISALLIRTPIESAIIDVWVHRDLFPEPFHPRPILFGELNTIPWADQIHEHAELLPLAERVESMGRGLPAAVLMDIPHYRSMVELAFNSTGWDHRDFSLYRLRQEYPVISTTLLMQFDLPKKPL